MKRITALLILFIGPALLSSLVGCDPCHPAPRRFHVDDYDVYIRKSLPDQLGVFPINPVSSLDTVKAAELELILFGKLTYVAYRTSGSNSVFACDPAVIALDTIRSVQIVSSQSYAADLPAGSNLTSVFGVGSAKYPRISIADYLAQTANRANEAYLLTLVKSPDHLSRHRFTIIVTLSNGKALEGTTEEVTIKP